MNTQNKKTACAFLSHKRASVARMSIESRGDHPRPFSLEAQFSATWLHKARELPKEEFKREVEKHLTGKEFKLYFVQPAIAPA